MASPSSLDMSSHIVNLDHFGVLRQENVKYLPGIKLGKNVVADPDLENAGT